MVCSLLWHGARLQDLSLDDPCTHEPGGNSVFIDLYGMSVIQYQSGKKIATTELTAVDPCASDDGKVAVQLPSKVQVYNESTGLYDLVPVAGYTVYGRILGKPGNGRDDPDGRSNILFSPNRVVSVSDEELFGLGLITWNAIYADGGDAYYRFEAPDEKAKGNSKARNMTPLFQFTGWVVDSILDTNGPGGVPDGAITILDVPLADYGSGVPSRDFNNDGVEDDADVEAWLATQSSLATEYVAEWVFNIADFVVTEGDITNDGTRLFQVRFYPYFD